MLNLVISVGGNFGWGICGIHLATELSAMGVGGGVRLITGPLTGTGGAGWEQMEQTFLKSLTMPGLDWDTTGEVELGGPALHAISGSTMTSVKPNLKGTRNVGYTFFEENVLTAEYLENARKNFDFILTGSTWNTQTMRDCGCERVGTMLQGVDSRVFRAADASAKKMFRDRFVVFSGGKFEVRKGQDIVIRAYKVLQDRHADVMLVNAWFNLWPQTMQTMSASPLIRMPNVTGQYHEVMGRVLAENGLDLGRVVTLGPRPNGMMPAVYYNTDVGIFPNRAEGGTNLVLMEYMACGRPAIGAWSTGQKDVLTEENSILIRNFRQLRLRDATQREVAIWEEPNLEETIAALEWAYQNRDRLGGIAKKGAEDMSGWTWEKTARVAYGAMMGD